jgi:hypothetical protein
MFISDAYAQMETPKGGEPANWSEFVFQNFTNILWFSLSIFILSIGVMALRMQINLLRHTDARPYEIMRICCVTLIITFGLALSAFKTPEALKEAAPILGLFSTIAGYLLGAAQARPSNDENQPPSGRETPPKNSN